MDFQRLCVQSSFSSPYNRLSIRHEWGKIMGKLYIFQIEFIKKITLLVRINGGLIEKEKTSQNYP